MSINDVIKKAHGIAHNLTYNDQPQGMAKQIIHEMAGILGSRVVRITRKAGTKTYTMTSLRGQSRTLTTSETFMWAIFQRPPSGMIALDSDDKDIPALADLDLFYNAKLLRLMMDASSGKLPPANHLLIEALRRMFCMLPRYSFHTGESGGVVRVPDNYGNWVEQSAVHEIFEPLFAEYAMKKLQTAMLIEKVQEDSKNTKNSDES